jgi:predicted nuclease with RNAse H fold
MMRTLGIDLAAQAKHTGACLIEWHDGVAEAHIIGGLLDDAQLIELARDADIVAVDSPLGWPDAFVEAVSAYHSGGEWPETEQRSLRYRATDLHLIATTGARPLSVSSDLIAACAFRAARLERALGPGSRGGQGRLAEVYPAGALRSWGMPATGYKGVAGAGVRAVIVRAIQQEWLSVDEAALMKRDHNLDALICALVARAVATGRTQQPRPEQAGAAAREGWIHIPTCPPGALISG